MPSRRPIVDSRFSRSAVVFLVIGALALGVFSAPYASSAIVASEICDNCFDDDGINGADRADPMCKAPANGNFVGLPDESAAKGAVKCQKAIEKASIAFATKKLGRLDKCVALAFACTQLKNGDQSCIDKATAACDKQVQGISGDESKAKAKIENACDDSQGGSVSLADIRDVTGLGYSGEESLLDCAATLSSTSNLADCVIDRHECGVERVLLASAPRAQELLVKLGHNVATEFPCLAAAAATKGTDGAGLGLGDAVQAKAAVKCQGAITKAAVKVTKIGTKNVEKCADAAATCIQLKPGVASCQTKAAAKCQKTFTKLTAFDGTFAKLITATAKKCAAPTFGPIQLNAPAGLGFVAVTDPSKRCSQFNLVFPDPTDQLVECVSKQYLCDGAYLLEREAPRLQEYAHFFNISIDVFGF